MKRLLPLALALAAWAQPRYDLVIQHGHVIDPANRIDAVMDVAISGGKIARVASNIPAAEAKKTVDAKGLYVTPGLIDLHAHVFGYSGSIHPDDTALPAGTTTVVDAGGSGWRTFDEMLEKVIKHSKTRVLSLINIVGHGMVGTTFEDNTEDMEPEKTAAKIIDRRANIVGIKTAHFGGNGWTAIDRAIAAGWPVIPTYGLSEMGSGVTALATNEAREAPGTAGRPLPAIVPSEPGHSDVHRIGELLFGTYWFPVQIVGVLLLAATVGVVVLSKKELK